MNETEADAFSRYAAHMNAIRDLEVELHDLATATGQHELALGKIRHLTDLAWLVNVDSMNEAMGGNLSLTDAADRLAELRSAFQDAVDDLRAAGPATPEGAS